MKKNVISFLHHVSKHSFFFTRRYVRWVLFKFMNLFKLCWKFCDKKANKDFSEFVYSTIFVEKNFFVRWRKGKNVKTLYNASELTKNTRIKK